MTKPNVLAGSDVWDYVTDLDFALGHKDRSTSSSTIVRFWSNVALTKPAWIRRQNAGEVANAFGVPVATSNPKLRNGMWR